MFFWVSRKKYKELEEKYNEANQKKQAEDLGMLIDSKSYIIIQEKVISLYKEVAKWKQMYADEVQKRIDLCEKVKKIEE